MRAPKRLKLLSSVPSRAGFSAETWTPPSRSTTLGLAITAASQRSKVCSFGNQIAGRLVAID